MRKYRFYLFLESLKGPQTCDTVRCSSGHICTIKVRECRWDESNFTFSWKWRQCTEQNFFFRMQTTNSSLRVGEGILRGCSFLRRFWMSVWETLHLARNLLRQSTLQAYQKLCGDARFSSTNESDLLSLIFSCVFFPSLYFTTSIWAKWLKWKFMT